MCAGHSGRGRELSGQTHHPPRSPGSGDEATSSQHTRLEHTEQRHAERKEVESGRKTIDSPSYSDSKIS